MRRITVPQKQAIVAQWMLGFTYRQIAQESKVSVAAIQRIVAAQKKLAAVSQDKTLQKSLLNYRDELKLKSIKTLEFALTPERSEKSEDYAIKAGGLAVQVLKGIGEFEGDRQAPGVAVYLSPPSSWAQKYNQPALDVTPQAQLPEATE